LASGLDSVAAATCGPPPSLLTPLVCNMPSSVCSAGSMRSATRSRSNPGGYRTLNYTADVDETLFGGTKSAIYAGLAGKEVAISGKDTVRVRNKFGRKGGSASATDLKSDAVVISACELNQLRDSSRLLSKEEEQDLKQRSEQAYQERMVKSKARKEKIMQMEEERKKHEMMVDQKSDSHAQKNSVLEKAKQKLDEDMDDVKHMNQMMLYSKVVTIRDAQIQEKRAIQRDRQEQEQNLDMMMEIERLKTLQMYEEREKARVEDQRRGASVIIEQIKDRQAQRMREEESRDQERAFILRQIDALKAEEVQQQQQKKLAAERLMMDVNTANTAAMKIKEEKMLAAKLEEQKIIEYQEAKDARDREIEEEKRRVAAEKEQETGKLRVMQEKAQDKAAEMDSLRAKRATEAAERRARKRENLEKERLASIHADLHNSRLQQQAEKERRLGEQAKFERDEYDRIVEVQVQQEDAERTRRAEEKEVRKLHCQDLKRQIGAREEKALQERRDFLEEGNGARAAIGSERKKLEKIKTQKIDELQKGGIPEKYWAELARKKISI